MIKINYPVGIISAGFGGQGILLIGKMIAEAGMLDKLDVSWLPSYGPEMRGGTAHCHTCVSNKLIGSPLVSNPDIVVAMNLPSMDKFEPMMKKGGLLIYNSSMIKREPKRKDIKGLGIKLTEAAEALGNPKVANMIALGALITIMPIVSWKNTVAALKVLVSAKGEEITKLDLKALEEGRKIGKKVLK